ncbi:hypothetical protein DEO72_LG5g2844 [Vigna unguiculata]|uniref:Uncharacterized protein n=1 Tax=Vigna unguiculata TaxID=3917 RepID=A0A4D6M2D4_VIGUN|nr:hypothetical protein DEO72_LG5g2844 [Vigna unguiculata]
MQSHKLSFVLLSLEGDAHGGRNPMTLVVELVVVPHHMDIIPWALLGGVHGGASVIGPNSMNLEVRVHGGASRSGRNSTRLMWWCLKART